MLPILYLRGLSTGDFRSSSPYPVSSSPLKSGRVAPRKEESRCHERMERFRRRIERRFGGRLGRGARYPEELRAEAVALARVAVGQGESLEAVAAELAARRSSSPSSCQRSPQTPPRRSAKSPPSWLLLLLLLLSSLKNARSSPLPCTPASARGRRWSRSSEPAPSSSAWRRLAVLEAAEMELIDGVLEEMVDRGETQRR